MSVSDATQSPTATASRLTTSRRAGLTGQPWLFALVLVVILLAANVITQDSFTSPQRWVGMITTLAPFVLVAFASTPQILAGRGGIDISTGPLTTLVNCVLVVEMLPRDVVSSWIALPILVLGGTVAGLLNGLLVVVGRLQPVIATLATFFVFSGIALSLSPTPVFAGDNWTQELGGSFGPFPAGATLVLVAALVWFALRRAGYVDALLLVGGDDLAAFSAGVNVAGVRLGAYALGGFFASLAGIALTTLIQTSQPTLAATYSLIALAAVSLGGTSLAGGRGGLVGSFLGASAIFLLQEFLGAAGVPVVYVQFMYGALLVAGVVLSGLVTRQGGRHG